MELFQLPAGYFVTLFADAAVSIKAGSGSVSNYAHNEGLIESGLKHVRFGNAS
jgi:hypothetical protein